TGIEALSTSSLVSDALRALGLKKLVVLSPYQSNADIIAYLGAAGFTVIKDVALKCNTAADFEAITPQRWLELARENDTPEADGVFLSCTNTTQIEAIESIELELGKPVVNSNQAVLWGCLKRLKNRLGEPFTPPSDLGSLMNDLEGYGRAAPPQAAGWKTRRVDGGLAASFSAGRIGRGAKLPPQFGHMPLSLVSTQPRQNVHSNVQIIASVAAGGRSLPQHSQLGRSSSIASSCLSRPLRARLVVLAEATMRATHRQEVAGRQD